MLRPDQNGRFDELLTMDSETCVVHIEMLDRDRFHLGLYPKDRPTRQMQLWIGIESGKLTARHEAS